MTGFDRDRPVLERGWILEGTDRRGGLIRLVVGETELARADLGLTVGRHPALCDRVIEDDTISRRHLRLGTEGGELFAEDLNSLNGTLVDGEALVPFEPAQLAEGRIMTLGDVVLTVTRLGEVNSRR